MRSTERLKKLNAGLTLLAEAFREELSDERRKIYISLLNDLTIEQFSLACNRAGQELKWFPKVAELREFAVGAPAERKMVEAEEAWQYVNEYLRRWGVDRLPVYGGGKVISAPVIPERIDYALRRIGGLWALNQAEADRIPFMHRDFCEAYNVAPLAFTMPMDRNLLGEVKQLAAAPTNETPVVITPKAKPFSTPVKDYAARRAELREQTQKVGK